MTSRTRSAKLESATRTRRSSVALTHGTDTATSASARATTRASRGGFGASGGPAPSGGGRGVGGGSGSIKSGRKRAGHASGTGNATETAAATTDASIPRARRERSALVALRNRRTRRGLETLEGFGPDVIERDRNRHDGTKLHVHLDTWTPGSVCGDGCVRRYDAVGRSRSALARVGTTRTAAARRRSRRRDRPYEEPALPLTPDAPEISRNCKALRSRACALAPTARLTSEARTDDHDASACNTLGAPGEAATLLIASVGG